MVVRLCYVFIYYYYYCVVVEGSVELVRGVTS